MEWSIVICSYLRDWNQKLIGSFRYKGGACWFLFFMVEWCGWVISVEIPNCQYLEVWFLQLANLSQEKGRNLLLSSWHQPVCVPSVTQSCLTLRPVVCSLPGSSVHGSFKARILEWAAISSSKGSSWPRDLTHFSYISRQILYPWATWEAHYLI